MADDIVARSDNLDREILAIPADRVFTKRTVIVGFGIVLAFLMVVLGVLVRFTADTRQAVTAEIPALQAQVAARDETIADHESVITQALDAIELLFQQILDMGGTPPEIVIRAPED